MGTCAEKERCTTNWMHLSILIVGKYSLNNLDPFIVRSTSYQISIHCPLPVQTQLSFMPTLLDEGPYILFQYLTLCFTSWANIRFVSTFLLLSCRCLQSGAFKYDFATFTFDKPSAMESLMKSFQGKNWTLSEEDKRHQKCEAMRENAEKKCEHCSKSMILYSH